MKPRLDIRHLEMMLALRETQSMTEAAERLGVTQSALSHRIREAERRLGVTLYTRQGRQLRPTLAEEHLGGQAARLLRDLENAERRALATAAGIRHLVRVAVGTYSNFGWLPAFLDRLGREHPEIDVDIAANAGTRPYMALIDGSLDIALSADTALPSPLAAVPLFTDELVVIVPPDHKLTAKAHVSAEDLVDYTFFTYSLTAVPGYEGERFWAPAARGPLRYLRIASIEAIVELVKAGQGISILSRWALEPHFTAGTLRAIALGESGLDIQWRAVTLRGRSEEPGIAAVTRVLRGWFSTPTLTLNL